MENNKPAKRALFIDRDGTLVVEPPVDYQLDSFEKMEFVPGVIRNLAFIAEKLDYELVMVTYLSARPRNNCAQPQPN